MYCKVLIVSNMYPSREYPNYGVFVRNFCDQLNEIGINYEISVLTKTKSTSLKLVKYGLFYVKTFFMCLFGGVDLVYIHYPSYSSKPVLAARKLRKYDIVSNVHGTDVVPLKKEHEKMLPNTKEAILHSKKVVVPSEYYKRLVVDKYKINNAQVFVYPSAGVDENVFFEYDDKRVNTLKKKFGISKDSIVIGFVSRITKAKGWSIFLDAIEELELPANKKIKIFMVGSGEDDDQLKDRINTFPYEIQKSIVRYPMLDQKKLAEIYNLLDVFVFPTISASESLGLVAIEAMACGCPVIASDYAAPKYYVIDGYNGYKFEKENSEELRIKLQLFLNMTKQQYGLLKIGAIETSNRFKKQYILKDLNKLLEK